MFDILSHLIIGSEGTLAFIEEVTYYTVEDYPNKASSLMFFRDIKDACNAVTKLKVAQDAGKISVAAAELTDRTTVGRSTATERAAAGRAAVERAAVERATERTLRCRARHRRARRC